MYPGGRRKRRGGNTSAARVASVRSGAHAHQAPPSAVHAARDTPTLSVAAVPDAKELCATPDGAPSSAAEASTDASSALGVIQIRTGRASSAEWKPRCTSWWLGHECAAAARGLLWGRRARG
eukprot:scaffold7105_cov116-Isochrysis_galbana.AAC.3